MKHECPKCGCKFASVVLSDSAARIAAAARLYVWHSEHERGYEGQMATTDSWNALKAAIKLEVPSKASDEAGG